MCGAPPPQTLSAQTHVEAFALWRQFASVVLSCGQRHP